MPNSKPSTVNRHKRVYLRLALIIATATFFQIAAQEQRFPLLTNRDILQMHTAGLSGDVIIEKIRTSSCDFDTSPASLADLAGNGLPDAVVLAMIRCKPGTGSSNVAVPSQPVRTASPDLPRGFLLSYIKSDRKWKLGLRSEPYDKVSEYFEEQLTASLDKTGIHRLAALDGGCCRLTLELLEVTTHPAMVKKPGIDVTANVTVSDSNNRLIYSKGYRGESRTMMNTYGHLINHAVEDMVKNILSDEAFMRGLGDGQAVPAATLSSQAHAR